MADTQAPVQPPSPHGPPRPGRPRGLAVASLVLGIVAIAGCLVPVLNLGSIVLALVGLGLGVPALVLARRGTRGGRGTALVGVVLSTIAVVAAVVADLLFGALVGATSVAVDRAAREVEGEVEGEDATAAPGDPGRPPVAALAPGTPATVGDYSVTVTAVDLDAAAEIAAADGSNEPATGQYVLVDLAVTYRGAESGDPWIDLGSDYLGGDARSYSETTCTAATGADGVDVPTLRTGGTASYSICFDVPAGAVAGGAVSVGAALSFADDAVVWSAG